MNTRSSQLQRAMAGKAPRSIYSSFHHAGNVASRPSSSVRTPQRRPGDRLETRDGQSSAQALLSGLLASGSRIAVASWENQTARVLPMLWTMLSSEIADYPETRYYRRSRQGPNRLMEEIESDRARTPLGKRLWALRAAIVKSGAHLLDWNELDDEIRERRGEAG
jgi:hypothetical protein